jgi:hypothetical protein
MNHKYIYLPSNSNSQNTTSDFTTVLPRTFNFKSNSNVALVELIYRHSWNVSVGYVLYTFNKKTYPMQIKYFKDSETIESLIILINKTIKENIIRKIYNERYMANYLYLNKGELFMKIDPLKFYPLSDYDTSKEEKVINQILLETEYSNAPQLVIENTFLKLQSNENFNGTIQFYGSVTKILELEDSNFFSKKYKYPLKESAYIGNIPNKEASVDVIGQLFIYAPDLIYNQFVGETEAPLLGIIVVEPNSFRKTIKINLDPPHYLPIKQNYINSIRILIADQFGNKILFDDSTVTLKLDFI